MYRGVVALLSEIFVLEFLKDKKVCLDGFLGKNMPIYHIPYSEYQIIFL